MRPLSSIPSITNLDSKHTPADKAMYLPASSLDAVIFKQPSNLSPVSSTGQALQILNRDQYPLLR